MPDLTPSQRQRLDILTAIAQDDPRAFEGDLTAYVFGEREPGDEAVFRHPQLLQHTFDALNRLIAFEEQRAATAAPGSAERRRRHQRRNALMREMAVVRPQATHQAAQGSIRRRAERIVGKVRYPELRKVMRALQDGMSDEAAEQALRDAVASAERRTRTDAEKRARHDEGRP